MRLLIFSFILQVCLAPMQAEVYTFEVAGDWNEESNWDTYPGTTIDLGDEVIIDADITVNIFITLNGEMTVSDNITTILGSAISINGSMTCNGDVVNNGQVNLFGDCYAHGNWENTNSGTSSIIITNTGNYFGYGDFINNGSVLGYNTSYMYLEGSFENKGSMTFNGNLELNHLGSAQFTNSDFTQFNGTLRLEGKLVNEVGKDFNINWSATFIVSDNSKIENYGTINIDGVGEISSLLNAHSVLGHIIVDDGDLSIKDSIAEIW